VPSRPIGQLGVTPRSMELHKPGHFIARAGGTLSPNSGFIPLHNDEPIVGIRLQGSTERDNSNELLPKSSQGREAGTGGLSAAIWS